MRRQHGHRTAHVATNDGVAQRSMLVGRVTLADDGTVLTARYVIGCDGARSSTRSAIGTAMLAARAAAVGETAPNGGAPMPPLSGPLVGASGGVLAAQPMVGGARLDDVIGPSWFVLARHDGDLDDTAGW
ncbi:MAG: FAD-dependent monooxygenase, partial [Ilumatobacteraceae bacterium]